MHFVVADTHFAHRNIITFCNRPFKDVHDMDTSLTSAWNQVVTEDDVVWVLGDFVWHTKAKTYLQHLKGKKALIVGNHDHRQTRKESLWEGGVYKWVQLSFPDMKLLLTHYPTPATNPGVFNLHGHEHGRGPSRLRCRDIGMDATKIYAPVPIATLESTLNVQTCSYR